MGAVGKVTKAKEKLQGEGRLIKGNQGRGEHRKKIPPFKKRRNIKDRKGGGDKEG